MTLEWLGLHSTIVTRVHDSGCGIPSDRLESVFEPFIQIDSSRAQSHGGTGLGLSISRDFAVGMGGQLLVESELGKGSTFTLSRSTEDEDSCKTREKWIEPALRASSCGRQSGSSRAPT